MACAWTGVGVTNSFLSRLFCNAEQRLSSVKWFIDRVYFWFFLRGISHRGHGDRRLRRGKAQVKRLPPGRNPWQQLFSSSKIRSPASSASQAPVLQRSRE